MTTTSPIVDPARKAINALRSACECIEQANWRTSGVLTELHEAITSIEIDLGRNRIGRAEALKQLEEALKLTEQGSARMIERVGIRIMEAIGHAKDMAELPRLKARRGGE